MREEIELSQLWEALKKRWIIIVALPLIALLATGVISFFITKPIYEASTTLIVGKKVANSPEAAGKMVDYVVLLASQKPVKTYIPIVQSRVVEQNVLRDLKLSMTVEELDKSLSVNAVKNPEQLEIKATNSNPKLAALIANTTAKAFSEAVTKDSVGIVDEAVTPINPIVNNVKRNLLLSFVLSLGASVIVILLSEYLDKTVKTTKDIEAVLGIPLLGVIHNYGNGQKKVKGGDLIGRVITYLNGNKITKF
ncbi:MAG TPA: Wzz/FepE/Etk N-terminal domain-containing protein [Desulfosporosinus sp.]|nr:Wzz/FepE/Etk N-terminal domain-containing protein [Desulfosporosinus sp.]